MTHPLYKAQMRNVPDWRDFSCAILSISVGAPYCEEDKLRAAIDLVNRRFASCVIDLGDSLQRHNMMAAGMCEAEALIVSHRAGDEWLYRNRFAINSLTIPRQLVRWDHWRQHPEYAYTRRCVDFAYKANRGFQQAVELDINGFLSRRSANDCLDRQWFAAHSRDYLLEEAAGNSLLERAFPGVVLYPARELHSLALIRTGAVPEIPAGMQDGRWAIMDFKHIEPRQTLDICHAAA